MNKRTAAVVALLALAGGALALAGLTVTGRIPVTPHAALPPAPERLPAPPAKPAPVVIVAPPAPIASAPSPPTPTPSPSQVETPPPRLALAPPAEPPAPPVPDVKAPELAIPEPAIQPASPAPAPPVATPAPAVAPPNAPVEAPAAIVTAPEPAAKPPADAQIAAVTPAAPPPEPPAPALAPPAADAPAIAAPKDGLPAKQLFAAQQLPSLGKAMAIGYYPRGCLSGGVPLAVNGPTWQVMRLSRNRNWGHPSLIRFLEEFAPRAAKATGWKGILVGDLSQPRGGPTPFGHMSHQTGLDVDIWFMPMPDRTLNKEEREKLSAINVVADDWKKLNPKFWTPQHIVFIKTAAEQPNVERVLVNAAIKQEICRVETRNRNGWMAKVRPWYGHHDHIHVRLKCPADSPNCRAQPAVPEDDGCGKEQLAFWFSDKVLKPPPKRVGPPPKPPKPITLADLPPACKDVLAAPEQQASKFGAN